MGGERVGGDEMHMASAPARWGTMIVLFLQGGFAYCYQFTLAAREMVLAGKVVAKKSLSRERARQKVSTPFFCEQNPSFCSFFCAFLPTSTPLIPFPIVSALG